MNATLLSREDVRFLMITTAVIVAWACVSTYLISNPWMQGGLLLLAYLTLGELQSSQQGDSR